MKINWKWFFAGIAVLLQLLCIDAKRWSEYPNMAEPLEEQSLFLLEPPASYDPEGDGKESSYNITLEQLERQWIADRILWDFNGNWNYYVSNDGIVSGNGPVNLGYSDFTIAFIARAQDWTPANYYDFFYNSLGDNANVVWFGLSTSLFAYVYDDAAQPTLYSQTLPAFTDGNSVLMFITGDRDGDLTWTYCELESRNYWLDSVSTDFSSAAGVDLTGVLGRYRWKNLTDYSFDAFKPLFVLNVAWTTDQIERYVNTFSPYGSRVGLGGHMYATDMSGHLSAGVTITGNVDGVSDGLSSRDDCTKVSASAVFQYHFSYLPNMEPGEIVIVSGEYYIPSGNSNVDYIAFQTNDSFYNANLTVTGAWTPFSFKYQVRSDGVVIQYPGSGSELEFAGVGDDTDDVYYLHNFRVETVGDLLSYQPPTNNIQLLSNTGLHAEVLGCELLPVGNTEDRLTYKAKVTWNGTSDSVTIRNDASFDDWAVKSVTLRASGTANFHVATIYEYIVQNFACTAGVVHDATIANRSVTHGAFYVQPTDPFTGELEVIIELERINL